MSKKEMYESFKKQLEENPFDPHLRRVFADWLEEEGFDRLAELQRDMAYSAETITSLREVYSEMCFCRVCRKIKEEVKEWQLRYHNAKTDFQNGVDSSSFWIHILTD